MTQLELNKKVVVDLFAAIDAGDKEKFMECEHPDFALQFTGIDGILDREGHWKMAGMHGTAYSDMAHIPEFQVAEGDVVITRGRIEGTNDGPYHGRPATGNKINIKFACTAYFKDGKIINIDSMFDTGAEYQQLYGPLY